MRSSSHPFSSLLLLGLICSAVPAASSTYHLSERFAKNQIVFESKAPLEYIEGTVGTLHGTVSLDPTQPNLKLSATISIPVASMQTGILQRDEHLRSRDWLDAAAYPSIRFDLDSLTSQDIVKKENQKWFVKAHGRFQMKGIVKQVEIPTTLSIKKEGSAEKLILEGRFSLKLADFSISGPAAMRAIGARVAEKVDIRLRVVGVLDQGWGNLSPKPAKKRRY